MSRWMINCEEHSRLASMGLDHRLPFWDRLSARMHRWICPPCRQLKKQFDAIRNACRGSLDEISEDQMEGDAARLPQDACRRMNAALRDRLDKR